MNHTRAAISSAILLAILVAAMFVPIPHYVYCEFYTQGANAENVYVDVPGTVNTLLVDQNTYVQANQAILKLTSQDLNMQLASLATASDLARVHRDNLSRTKSADGQQSNELLSAEAAYYAASKIYAKRYQDLDRLTVRAPVSGLLIAAPPVKASDSNEKSLEKWIGTPLDRKNVGAELEQSTLVGQVIPDPKKLEAVLAIDQSDVEFIRKEQSVKLLVNQVPCETFESTVRLVTPNEMRDTPRALSSKNGGPIVTTTARDGAEIPTSTKYLVKVDLENPDRLVVPGSTGTAKINAGNQTVGQRIWRLASRTFQFEL